MKIEIGHIDRSLGKFIILRKEHFSSYLILYLQIWRANFLTIWTGWLRFSCTIPVLGSSRPVYPTSHQITLYKVINFAILQSLYRSQANNSVLNDIEQYRRNHWYSSIVQTMRNHSGLTKTFLD